MTVIKTILKIIAGLFAVAIVAAGISVALLIYPGIPGTAASLSFDGFIPLPAAQKKSLITVMDYVSISGRSLFVTSESDGSVYEVPLGGRRLPSASDVRILQGDPAAHRVVVDPVSHLAFVTRSDADRVDIFDPVTLQTVKEISVADDADGMFYDPKNKLIYVVNGDPNLGTVIDPASQTKIGTIALGGKPEFAAFDDLTGQFYQNLNDKNELALVDLAKMNVVDKWRLAHCDGPTGMAIDEPDSRLFVVCTRNSQLVIVDLNAHRVIAFFPVGGGPDAVAYDPELRRLYVTGKSGVLTVTQQDSADTYHLLDTVKLHYGAHTLAIDPVTHQLYVAYASLLIPPRLAVFDARP